MSCSNKIDIGGCIIIIVLFVIDGIVYFIEPYRPEFFEGDPTISRPYHDSAVGDVTVFIYSLAIPLVIIILSYLIIPRMTDKIKLPV